MFGKKSKKEAKVKGCKSKANVEASTESTKSSSKSTSKTKACK